MKTSDRMPASRPPAGSTDPSKTPPTAWMIIPTFFPVVGGAQVQVQQVSTALMGLGREARVLTRRHSYAHPWGLPAQENIQGVPTTRLYSRGGGKAGALLYVFGGIWHLLRHGRGQIYHAHDAGAAGWLAVLARTLLGGRCLVKLRTGQVAYEQGLSSRLRRWQFQALLRSADCILVVNREMEEFLAQLGIRTRRLVCLPNGIDPDRFCPATSQEKAEARGRLGLPALEQIILYVGRFEHMKGVDILLRGYKAYRQQTARPGVLLLVGDGPEGARLKRLAAEWAIEESVLFAGEQPQVLDYYHAADLFVLPSRTEGLSNALLEAMACGLPVAASRVGGAKDLVLNGENGFLFESEDAQGLANRLSQLLTSPSQLDRFGQHARSTVLDYASLPMIVERLQTVYDELFS